MATSGWMKRIERGLRQPWTGRKVVDSPLLNRAGLQVLRTAAAHGVYRLRPGPASPELAPVLARLRRDGTLVLPDFLPGDEFQALAEEC
ncbi:MAG: hypothetical protein R3344_08335, partial [Acidobacteriota bacterium]|nr:hypothetical protein [Acidobacteriota bacterium]